MTNLLEFFKEVTQTPGRKKTWDIICLDFKRLFDTSQPTGWCIKVQQVKKCTNFEWTNKIKEVNSLVVLSAKNRGNKVEHVLFCAHKIKEDIITQISNQMDHIEPLCRRQSNILYNGHDIHFNCKMRSFNIRSLMYNDALENAQQKKLEETLGKTPEDFTMGRRLTRQMELRTTGQTG